MKRYRQVAVSLVVSVVLIAGSLLITPHRTYPEQKTHTYVLALEPGSFTDEVINSKQPVVADFFAQWCPACQNAAPTFAKVAQTLQGPVKCVSVNVEQFPAQASEYKIESIPTFVLFDKGAVVASFVGALSEDAMTTAIKNKFKL